jgi:hypothetical protein
MPMNRIQFQQGMSLPEFMASFGTEEQCAEAVRQALTLEAVGQWAQAALMPGARVVSDGLGCFAAPGGVRLPLQSPVRPAWAGGSAHHRCLAVQASGSADRSGEY